MVHVAVFPAASGAVNFALDEALAERAGATGETWIRVYAWERPTVSFGRNEAARDRFSAQAFADRGIDVVRRPTGGRALVHHRELTYAIAGPATPGEPLSHQYAETQHLIVRALRVLGVHAGIADGTRPASMGPVCFAAPARGEIVVGTRKLAASAQWQHDGAWLQHGSILLHDDQSLLNCGLAPGVSLPLLPPPATLVDELHRAPTHEELARAFASAIESEGQTARLVDAHDFALAPDRFISRYQDEAWTWRR